MAEALDRAGAELQPLCPDGIRTTDLVRRASELSGLDEKSFRPADFCYNHTNRGVHPPPHNNPVFLRLREGYFRYVGRGFPYTGPVTGANQSGATERRFVTSRGYALPATAEEMAASPWFKLWKTQQWPYKQVEAGSTLYWYDTGEKAVIWVSRVSRAERFDYETVGELLDRLRVIFGTIDSSDPYLEEAAARKYCLAYRVDQVRPVRVPKPAGFKFPRDGWLRCDDESARDWVSQFPSRMDPDGAAAPDLLRAGAAVTESGYFALPPGGDERERVLREIVQRRGQSEFRTQLLAAYGERCAVTGCDAPAALEAAHLDPYTGLASQHVANGLLLRADLHTLFDLDLIGIEPDTLTVAIAPVIRQTAYAPLHGVPLRCPADPADGPDRDALTRRWQRFVDAEAGHDRD